MVVSSLEGYTLFKGITGVYFYSFESIITLSLSLFYLTKLIFMKIVRFKTVGGKSLVMISLLLMAPMHIYSSDTFTIQEKTRVHQQTVQLTGVVLDIQGFPLVGVNIMENATNGTITDIDGKFSIKVTPQSVLHVSYIGYVTQTVKVGNKKNISIVMEEDSDPRRSCSCRLWITEESISNGCCCCHSNKRIKTEFSCKFINSVGWTYARFDSYADFGTSWW